MDRWLAAALDYLPRWLEHQLRLTEQPGLQFAVALNGKPVLDLALGHANLRSGEALTPQHRLRVASHSKTFTATALLKLRDQGRLRLDDPVGRYVDGLHATVAATPLAQLLSHSAGLVRDGADSGQWLERRPFLNEADLRADLAGGPTIDPNTRFKYSNHGYGLLGLVVAAVTGEPYLDWVAREVVAASGLKDTFPDVDRAPPALKLAHGHSLKWPAGERLPLAAAMSTHALASATGFVSTAADLARFFGSLSPQARRSVLSVEARRELARRQWREPHSSVERWYGLGTMSGTLTGLAGAWDWFGHTGGFPGTLSRTVCVPSQGLTISAIGNAADTLVGTWVDGALHVLQAHAALGAPSRRTAAWTGRWWSLWGSWDLLPLADRVLVANPSLANPLTDAMQITVDGKGRDGALHGRITLANGYASHGEPAALTLDANGRATSLKLAGATLGTEAAALRELRARYGKA